MTDIIGNKTLKKQWEEAAKEWPNKLFMIFEDRAGNVEQATYREFYDKISQTANMFIDLGVKRARQLQYSFSTVRILCCVGSVLHKSVPLSSH